MQPVGTRQCPRTWPDLGHHASVVGYLHNQVESLMDVDDLCNVHSPLPIIASTNKMPCYHTEDHAMPQ